MISIRRLQKRFDVSDGVIAAIRSLDLEIAEGELFVIVGASGSGKTTLLRCLAGLETPDSGEIRISDRVVSSDNPPTWVPPQQRELGKQLGSTMLYVTHDQIEAMAIADRIALMQAGELLQVGTPLEIYHKPNCADVAEFFGSVNWVDAQVVESGVADSAIGKLKIEGSSQIGDKVLLGFRPE